MKGVAVLGVLVLLLLVPPAVSQAPDDRLIVPGQRIGKWTLQMTINDLLQMNGPRNARGAGGLELSPPLGGEWPATDLWVHRWIEQGIIAVTIGRESQTVVLLDTILSGYRTDKGIGFGSSREAVLTAYGPPTAATVPLPDWWRGIYDGIGLAVAVRPGTGVDSVSVFRPGTAKTLFRF